MRIQSAIAEIPEGPMTQSELAHILIHKLNVIIHLLVVMNKGFFL